MMEPKDWISGLVGAVIFCLGLLPLLNNLSIGPGWFGFNLPIKILSWMVAIGGFYLVINSFRGVRIIYSFSTTKTLVYLSIA